MTTHLRDTEFVDALDGILPAGRRQHLDGCPECRKHLQALEHALALTRDEVPEPSPLFWNHLSARVRRAIEREPVRTRRGLAWLREPAFGVLAAGGATIVLLALVSWRTEVSPPVVPVSPPTALSDAIGSDAPTGAPTSVDDTDVEQDPAWALVRSLADELEAAEIDATGLAPRPGAAERVANGLNERERVELASLLEDAIKAGAARVPSS